MGMFFVCKKFAADGKTFYGDVIPVEDTLHSIDDQGRAERLALKKFLDSGGKDEVFVVEGRIVFKPAVVNALEGKPIEQDTLAAITKGPARAVDGAARSKSS
jgi:hypothetical protein